VTNSALKNITPDRVRLHICWGNSESPHDSDVPLEDILPAVQRANVGALYLPFAGPRHAHEYRCFEKFSLKADQILVAGMIDPLTNIVEHPEVVSGPGPSSAASGTERGSLPRGCSDSFKRERRTVLLAVHSRGACPRPSRAY
jgi:hypothetical protein